MHCLLHRFKGSHQELSKYSKNLRQRKVFVSLPYFIFEFNVIHLIYVAKCFSSNVIILITTKNYMNFIFYSFFLTTVANFHIIFYWRLPLGGVYCKVMKWQPCFSYSIPIVEVMQIYIIFFLKSSFVCEKSYSLHFISVKEGLDTTLLSSFFGKTYACFYIPSSLFHHSTPWIYSSWG